MQLNIHVGNVSAREKNAIFKRFRFEVMKMIREKKMWKKRLNSFFCISQAQLVAAILYGKWKCDVYRLYKMYIIANYITRVLRWAKMEQSNKESSAHRMNNTYTTFQLFSSPFICCHWNYFERSGIAGQLQWHNDDI